MNTWVRAGVLTLLLHALPAAAQTTGCDLPLLTGASMPQGAAGMMTVVNDGQPCGMTVYGVAVERRNPADSGTIKRVPMHGKAEFVGPRVQYTPDPGYAGDDEFSFEAFARGASGAAMLLKVRMRVTVLAPR